ncbi:MAG: type II toxin-antitoxin system RelE/ParE family toxin [Pseudomonadota bacterium]|nr:type II toxin-antitoxin system RelE/ParE family toxin [Pseudomonadota bacterium]
MRFKRSAEKQFGDLPPKARKELAPKIDELTQNPRPNGVEKLKGYRDLWRIRWGNYRVIFTGPDSEGVIRILKVADRREAYRGLGSL